MASLLLVITSWACYVIAFAKGSRAAKPVREVAYAGAGAPAIESLSDDDSADDYDEDVVDGPTPSQVMAKTTGGFAQYGTTLSRIACLTLLGSLITRALYTGHGPFANQYEFAVAFGWGMVAAYVYFEWRYHVRTMALIVLPISSALLAYAMLVGDSPIPLVPALQNNLLLSLHVAVAIVAYGAFAVASAAAAITILRPWLGRFKLPKNEVLEEIAYRAVLIGFPLDTMVVILGALWAEVAWGSYWSWDPKETASLVTWLIYGAYLHARVVRGWRGKRAAWLLIAGFAAVVFTFFGNLFFGGLHSYSGMQK
ncbi:MAG: c-type cytochrome biogenesis protein CcsB [Actinomycetes bacterium]